MSVMVKKAVLWRKEIDNRPGMLANTLEPSPKRAPTCKSSWAIVTLVERIRPLSSYIRFPAGSRRRRQRHPVSPRHLLYRL